MFLNALLSVNAILREKFLSEREKKKNAFISE
jgi:hypothetical protein